MKQKTKGSYFEKWLKELISLKFDGEVAVANMTRDTSFASIGIDSLSLYELVYSLEEGLCVNIPDEDANQLDSIAAVENYLNKQLEENGKKSSVSKRALALDVIEMLDIEPNMDLRLQMPIMALYKKSHRFGPNSTVGNLQEGFGIELPPTIYGDHGKYVSLCGAKTLGGIINIVAREIEYET